MLSPNPFYCINTKYRLIPHSDTWNCIELNKTHAVFISLEKGIKYSVPHHSQHKWMYKVPKIGPAA